MGQNLMSLVHILAEIEKLEKNIMIVLLLTKKDLLSRYF